MSVGKLVGVTLFLLVLVGLSPVIFQGVADFADDTNVPAWLAAIFGVIIGIVVLMLVLKAGGIKTGGM